MTDKELQKLRRAELLEILVEQAKEIEALREQVAELQAKVNERQIRIDKAGNIAEASLQLSGVFEAAQEASKQYLDNIENLSKRQEIICAEMEKQTKAKCTEMETETLKKCTEMERETDKRIEEKWQQLSKRLEDFYAAHEGLRELISVTGNLREK